MMDEDTRKFDPRKHWADVNCENFRTPKKVYYDYFVNWEEQYGPAAPRKCQALFKTLTLAMQHAEVLKRRPECKHVIVSTEISKR